MRRFLRSRLSNTILISTIVSPLFLSNVFAENIHPMFARGSAMGDAGVAHADALEAPYYNPALLATSKNKKDKNSFSLSIPTVGVRVNNPEDLLDEIDKIQDETMPAFDALGSADGQAYSDAAGLLLNNLNAIKTEQLRATVSAALIASGKIGGFGVALSSIGSAKVLMTPNISQVDLTTLEQIENNPASHDISSSDLTSTADAAVLGINELGFSLAGKLLTEKLRWGVTPKIVSVTSYHYIAKIDTFDFDDFDNPTHEETDTHFNLDLGLAFTPTPSLTFGATAKNIAEKSYKTSKNIKYDLEKQLLLGVAWSPANITLAADWELTKNEELINKNENQYLGVGAEVALGIIALRAGYRKNLKTDNDNDVFSAGVGLKAGPVKIDLAGQSLDDEAAAALQFALVF